MRAASLLLVFILAKAAVLSSHTVSPSFLTPIAYLWQDVLVVLVFGVVECIIRRGSTWLYWTLAVYAAVNIPVGRAVSTPLTWPMLRAARGPLADSLLLYLTWTNVALVLLTLAAAAGLPWLLRRLPRRVFAAAAVAGVAIVAAGPAASARVETSGFERNAVLTLMSSALPRIQSRPGTGDWRASRLERNAADDLSAFRGLAVDRNVVMVSLESTAAGYLALYGGAYDLMPHLSALARSALVFENSYAVYPESIKGLYSVLCSTYPAFDTRPEAYEKVPCGSVAAVLADAGYRTAVFHSGRFAYLGMESIIQNRGYGTLEDAGDIGGNHQSSFGVDEPSTVARMLSWIDAQPRSGRFFLTYLPIAGHHPYETPQRGPFPDREEIGRYRNALRYGDAALGSLAEGLRARGLMENTVWIIFGDHGEAFGQHEGNYGHTFALYDENVRVPFLVVAPGAIQKQFRTRKVVSLVDTAPTLLDLLGIPAPERYQGRSMLDSTPRMALFFADYSLGMLGLRDGPWKFIYELESGRSKMFDIDRDAQEKTDVSTANHERAARYGQIVRGWSGAQISYAAQWDGRRRAP